MDQTPVRNGLHEALADERECCRSLRQVLAAERAAAVSHDLRGLLASLREREVLQARWRAAATRLERALDALCEPLSVIAQRDPELAAIVRDVAGEAGSLRHAQRVNELIVRSALGTVSDLLEALRRELPGRRYDGNATITAPLPASPNARWQA